MGRPRHPHHIRFFIAMAAAAIAMALPSAGFAHTLTLSKAKTAAAAQAQKIKRDTDARSSTVTVCARKTLHKFLCKVKSRYSSGLSTCVTDVTIYYASHSSTRPKTTVNRTNCS